MRFPFSKAKYILLISFTNYDIDPDEWDSVSRRWKERNDPDLSDTLGYKDVHEVKILPLKGSKKLYNLIFTYEYSKPVLIMGQWVASGKITSSGCYWPRNAVLFRDENDSTIGGLELCFECKGFKTWPVKFHPQLENSDYDAIKKIFKDAGITYGTSTRAFEKHRIKMPLPARKTNRPLS